MNLDGLNDAIEPFDLTRFVSAQKEVFLLALSEVKQGRKRSHWMWFIFPQLRGLGHSPTSQRFGISGIDEARAYLDHELLGPRLRTISEATLAIENRSAREIFGSPDDLKLRSSATLFAQVSESGSVFQQILSKYFDGRADRRTLELLESDST